MLCPSVGLAQAPAVAEAVRTMVAPARLPGSAAPNLDTERALLDRLYLPGAYAALWLTGARPNARGQAAIAALRAVGAQGLDPRDYESDRLADEATRLAAVTETSAPTLARFDVALSTALVRLITDLHIGRVDPVALGFGYDRVPKRAELGPVVDDLARGAPVDEVVAAAAPHFLQTLLLERQLARYRELAADPTPAPVLPEKTIRPGNRLDAAADLARWLAALGDLPADAAVSTVYGGALLAAVQRFQARHGLAPDGVIGAATVRALAVPAAARVWQIELALERLRWLPVLAPDRTVIVNVPGFELFAYDEVGAGHPPALAMGVIVGQALRTETPFFAGTMTSVVFAPYWNVPPSILHKELLPKIRADAGYLAQEEMEIVSAGHVLAPTAAAIARLDRGEAELRQRPGAKNALGHVKFLFPNHFNVYMHDTPAHALFAKNRRDFSHGCIRLADAPALAHWVFAGEGWEAARVDEMLGREDEKVVPLRRSIAVVIAYTTVVARRDGTITFYDDVYEHDAALVTALAERAYRR